MNQDKSDKFYAIIIKDSSDLALNNKVADVFYNEVKNHLEDLGFETHFFDGTPNESPPFADLWLGHLNGAESLKFASSATRIISLSEEEHSGTEHSDDFELTDHMLEMIERNAEHVKNLARFQEDILLLADRMQLSS